MSERLELVLDRVIDHLESGEPRAGQRRMAEAVEEAIEAERHLVVRAGTGTGKSIAYLVPALLSGRRVVVATATKALQDQLARKDLPGVEPHLGRRVTSAVLKGRVNYLCVQRAREAEAAGAQEELLLGEGAKASSRLAEQAKAVAEWAKTTTTGDRDELAMEVDHRVWGSFSVSSEECPGPHRCPSGEDCLAEAARLRASTADLVVTNLHLLGAHVASGGMVLPEHEVLVVDEAHELEEVMSDCLGIVIGPGRLRGVAGAVRGAAGPAGKARALHDLADEILELAGRLEVVLEPRRGERLRAGPDGELGGLVALAVGRLERVERELRRVESGEGAPNERAQRAVRAVLAVGRLREDFQRLQAVGDDEVAWVGDGPRPSLELAPIDVAPLLAERLFGERSVVLTSATVPLPLAGRLGADPDGTDVLDVGSPFAYEEHALLYCAAHLPDRRRPEAEAAIHEELAGLIEAAGGRTLALFTSLAAMRRAATELASRLDLPILCQGQRSKAALLEEFVAEPAASLFATMGFWQGVDVPGPTLSLVVIDRLPFARPDDPLLAARRERAGPAAFATIDLPRAASLLAQGAGRLIRGAEDRGVVAVLDPRLARASYRWTLVRALPPMRRTKDPEEVRAFLRSIRDANPPVGRG